MSCRTGMSCTSCSMSERISWLDGWRGAVCWMMLVYHLLFDMMMFGWLSYEDLMSVPMVLFEKVIAYSFILCAGISATLTRSNLRRGVITLGAAVLVTAASYIVQAPILFGILHFLGIAMLLYAWIGKALSRLRSPVVPFVCLLLFVVTHILTDRVLVTARWLFWLGFRYDGFVSYDYFPILPYIFLFLLGTRAGLLLTENRERLPILNKQAPAVLTWPGRRTLWIYLVHQPVLYGACWLIRRFG